MKKLRVTFSNGEVYDIPAEYIARQRAGYYINNDIAQGDVEEKDRESAIQKEIEYALEDSYEIYDWAANNMNWEDVKDEATFVDAPVLEIDYEKEWTNVDKEIIEE